MYEAEDDFVDEGEEGEEISNEIWQEVVIFAIKRFLKFLSFFFLILHIGLLDRDIVVFRGEGSRQTAARHVRRVYLDERPENRRGRPADRPPGRDRGPALLPAQVRADLPEQADTLGEGRRPGPSPMMPNEVNTSDLSQSDESEASRKTSFSYTRFFIRRGSRGCGTSPTPRASTWTSPRRW